MLKLIPTATMAFMAQFDLKNATVRLVDGTTPNANFLTIKIGQGTITWDEEVKREYTLDRGKLSGIRNGDDTPLAVTLDFIWEFLKGSTTTVITPEDFLKQRGGASAYKSTDADLCNPFAVDIQVFYSPCSTKMTEDILMPDFRYEKLSMDPKAGVVKCTGRCNTIAATIARRVYTTVIVSP